MHEPANPACVICSGGKVCPSCHGTGLISRLLVWMVCGLCKGDGACFNCREQGEAEPEADSEIPK